MTLSRAHYIITGTDDAGRARTPDTYGKDTLSDVADAVSDLIGDGWQHVFVYRRDDADDFPILVECTPKIANLVFGRWLEAFGMEDDVEHPIPDWFDTQLERLTLSARRERILYRLGYRHAQDAA